MGYEIEKFNGKSETPSAAGSKIDDALNRLRQGREASASRGPEKGAAAGDCPHSAAADIVEVARVCAVHDKPYVAVYVRGAKGLFRFSKSIKGRPESSRPWMGESGGLENLNDKQLKSAARSYEAWGGNKEKFDFADYVAYVQKQWQTKNAVPSGGGNQVMIEAGEFETEKPGECCAWCGSKLGPFGAVKCGVCEAWVCRGRTQNNYFQCRDSCGAAGDIENSITVATEGTARKNANPQASGAAPEKGGGQAAGSVKRLLLGPAGK